METRPVFVRYLGIGTINEIRIIALCYNKCMSFLKNFSKIFSMRPTDQQRSVYLYVQCNKCGEKLRARVDTFNELTPEFDGKSDEPVSYFCRKVLIGEKQCYQPIELRLTFSRNHKLTSQEISGGKFIREEDFLKLN
jgi:hypothetical protein